MRKLAWAALSFAAAVTLRHYVLPREAVLYAVALLGVFAGLAIFVPDKRYRMGIFLVCVSALLGLARYEWQYAAKVEPAQALIGQTHRITAEVTEYPAVYADYTRITAVLQTEGLPETKIILYDYEPGGALKPGDRISSLVKFTSATESAGEGTDSYISKGIYLRGYVEDWIILQGTAADNWRYAPLYLGKAVRAALDNYMTERTAPFMKALLTGEKTDLYAQSEIYHVITRSGISHVVAVSGMHVSFLVGIAVLLFGGGRGWLISVGFAALFAVMTGLSPSVMRALLMQTLFLTAPLLRREADDITSICFPLLLLLVLNPFAIASVSLQLSFGAMWGIILVTPLLVRWFGEREKHFGGIFLRAYRYVYASVAMSLGATVFTAPLCAGYFGTIALLSPLTNLLVLWLVPLCFGCGLLVFLLSFVSAGLAGICGAVLSCMVEVIYALAGAVANMDYAQVFLPTSMMVLWFVVTFALFAICFRCKGKLLHRPLVYAGISAVLLLGLMCGVNYSYSHGTTVGAVDVGQGQSIVLLHEDSAVVFDCGGQYVAGEQTARWLRRHGVKEVDMLFLTHFDEDHVSGVVDLLVEIPVKEIVFCGAVLEDEEVERFHEIRLLAEQKGTEMRNVNRNRILNCGDIRVTTLVTDDGLVALAQAGDFELLVTGDADWRTEEEVVAMSLPQGDCLVVGHHGSKYSTGETLLDRYRPAFAIISCGYNSYGHPTEEVLDRLRERNVVIYRTDIHGDISLKVR